VLWELVAEPIALDEATEVMAELYGAPPEEVRPAVASALDDLAARGIIEAVPGS